MPFTVQHSAARTEQPEGTMGRLFSHWHWHDTHGDGAVRSEPARNRKGSLSTPRVARIAVATVGAQSLVRFARGSSRFSVTFSSPRS
jgi:hypothetical protein